MLSKRIIPCLDIDKGRVVKGVNFVNLVDAGDPVEIARAYDKIGADEIVFLDITASSDGRKTAVDILSRASEQVFIPLTVGGGIRTVEDFRQLLAAGADKIAVNSAAIQNPQLISEAALRFGSQCVVLAVDAKQNERGGWDVYLNGGRVRTDLDAIEWLEEFLINFENTVIVVSHDRYFLNKVCTQIADIDYGKIQLYAGNYDFWFESSQLLVKQMKEANKKKEEKIKELQDFISRFSANASKSKQATSRKKALEKIQLDDIKPSSRKYPYIDFRPNREIGNDVLQVEGLTKTVDGVKILDNLSFTLGREDKVAFVGSNEQAITMLFKILTGEEEPDSGYYKWGVTTTQAYFPKDNTAEFDCDLTIADWLTQYSEIKDVTYVRGFLGRMLFAGEDGVKRVRVLSGGEKVRCLLSKMMISGANVLVLDEPTNHLDMESITALNNGLIKFPGVLLFTCHDHQFVQTTANRIMEILPNGALIDKMTTYDEYLASDEMARKRHVYTMTEEDN